MKNRKNLQKSQSNGTSVSTILFDWDGCLADTLEAWLSSYESAILPYVPWITRDFILKNHLMADFTLIRQFKLGKPNEVKILNSILEQVHRFGESVELAQEIKDILSKLQRNGVQLAIVSSAPRSFIEPQLQRFELEEFFPVVITGNDVIHLKPHPEPLKKALQLLGTSADTAIMIGDTRSDILAGKAAGTRTAVYFPKRNEALYDKDDMLALNADYYFRSFEDLHTILYEEIYTT